MRGRPHLFVSYEAEQSLFPTWTQRVLLAAAALVLLLLTMGTTLDFGEGKPVFVKLEEGDWESGGDEEGLLDAVRAASAERPYLLELKTPESARRTSASAKKYEKYGVRAR